MVLADEEAYEDLDVRWRLLRKLPVDSEAWLRRAIWRANLWTALRPRSDTPKRTFHAVASRCLQLDTATRIHVWQAEIAAIGYGVCFCSESIFDVLSAAVYDRHENGARARFD